MRGYALGLLVMVEAACGQSSELPLDGSLDAPLDPCAPPGACITPARPSLASAYPLLSGRQWDRTVSDLLGVEERPRLEPHVLVVDPRRPSTSSDVVEPRRAVAQRELAEAVASEVTRDPALLSRITGSDSDPRTFYPAFLARAYRRPPSDAELTAALAMHARGATEYPDDPRLAAGVRLVIEAVLQSPAFLYRVMSGESREGVVTLDGFSLASRLSYALWDSMPDDALFADAASGALLEPEVFRAHAFRMLDDPRAVSKIGDFHVAYLGAIEPFAALVETRRLSARLVLDDAADVRDLLVTRAAFGNALAEAYEVMPTHDEWLSLDDRRPGLLTRQHWLRRARPISRGHDVVTRWLCIDIPPPPTPVPPESEGVGATRRERIESLTREEGCIDCHRMIDPIGFAFESFDAEGRWRTEEPPSGAPIDTTGEVIVAERTLVFSGAADLVTQLAELPELHRCYAKHWQAVLLEDPSYVDDTSLDLVAEGSVTRGWSIAEVIVALLNSDSFRTRRAE